MRWGHWQLLNGSGVATIAGTQEAFRGRSLEGETYPYLWLDATYVKVRESGRVVSMAALVAMGVGESGERRILGLDLAPETPRAVPRRASAVASSSAASAESGSSSAMPTPVS